MISSVHSTVELIWRENKEFNRQHIRTEPEKVQLQGGIWNTNWHQEIGYYTENKSATAFCQNLKQMRTVEYCQWYWLMADPLSPTVLLQWWWYMILKPGSSKDLYLNNINSLMYCTNTAIGRLICHMETRCVPTLTGMFQGDTDKENTHCDHATHKTCAWSIWIWLVKITIHACILWLGTQNPSHFVFLSIARSGLFCDIGLDENITTLTSRFQSWTNRQKTQNLTIHQENINLPSHRAPGTWLLPSHVVL